MTSENDPAPARNATRAPIDRPVRLQFEDSAEVVEGSSRNVSIGGMFVTDVGSRTRGEQVRFELVLDDSTSIRGLAEVVWSQSSGGGSRDAGLGLKFRFLEQRDRQQIFRLVSQHIKERLAREGPAPSAPSLFAETEPDEQAAAGAVAAGIDVPPEIATKPAKTTQGSLFDDLSASGPAAPAAPRPFAPGASDLSDPAGEEPTLGADPWTMPEPEGGRPGGRKRGGPARVLIPLGVVALAAGAWWFLRGDDAGPEPAAIAAAAPEAGGAPPVDDVGESPSPQVDPVVPPPDPGSTVPPATAPVPVAPPPPAAPTAPDPAPPPRVAPTAPADTASSAPYSRLVDLRWRRDGDDLVLVLETDGTVEEGRFKYFRIGGDNPREVVRLLGVAEAYPRTEAPVPEVDAVARVRFGFHRKPEGDELHVVVDLADPRWQLAEVAPRGNRLEGVFRRQ